MNILEDQEMQVDFDVISGLKSLGNSILSLFKGNEAEDEKDDHIQIEISKDDNTIIQANHTILLGSN